MRKYKHKRSRLTKESLEDVAWTLFGLGCVFLVLMLLYTLSDVAWRALFH